MGTRWRMAAGLIGSLLLGPSACASVLGIDEDYQDVEGVGDGGSSSSAGSGSPAAGSSAAGKSTGGGATSGGQQGQGGDGASTGGGGSSSTGGGGSSSTGGGGSSSTGGGGSSSTGCEGALSNGVCWYLGGVAENCSVTCSAHGGESPEAPSVVGIPAQGGSAQKCGTILSLLGYPEAPSQATRSDGKGLGCHIYGAKTYWLSSPSYSPSASGMNARIACGCER